MKRTPLVRRAPLRSFRRLRSHGSSSYQDEFAAVKPEVRRRSQGRCEASAGPGCSGAAVHVHHRRRRAQGGTNDLANLLDVCAWCHDFIHAHPAVSYERGWLVLGASGG